LYLNGHNHNLEHYEINGQAKYMTTGAGGMVVIGRAHGHGHGDDDDDDDDDTHTTMVTKSIWSKVVTGYTSHTFTNNGTSLITKFWEAKVSRTPLHQFKVDLESE
jgi:hypothetical protein